MALVDDLLAQVRRPGVPCTLGKYIATLSDKSVKGEPSERQQLIDAINDERIPRQTIATYLSTVGCKITPLTVGKHRNATCIGCGPDGSGWFG